MQKCLPFFFFLVHFPEKVLGLWEAVWLACASGKSAFIFDDDSNAAFIAHYPIWPSPTQSCQSRYLQFIFICTHWFYTILGNQSKGVILEAFMISILSWLKLGQVLGRYLRYS